MVKGHQILPGPWTKLLGPPRLLTVLFKVQSKGSLLTGSLAGHPQRKVNPSHNKLAPLVVWVSWLL